MLVLEGVNKMVFGAALYDMDRFLSQPHPFDASTTKTPGASPGPAPWQPQAGPAQDLRPANFYRGDQPLTRSSSARGPGAAGSPPSVRRGTPLWEVISELRLGVLSHDVKFPNRKDVEAPNPFDNRHESGVNLNPEVVFVSPGFLDFMWSPRPHIGLTANLGGDTNSAYTGLSWDALWRNGLFLEGFLGLAVHDGKLRNGNPDNIEFGSRVLFRLGGEFGWRWNDANGISLVWEHMSNAGVISDKNQGIDSLGLRYSYRFSY